MTYQAHWEQQIYKASLPLWMRVYALAMARSEPNLHTGIGPNELAILGDSEADGTRKHVDRRRLSEAINRLIELDWLDSKSDRNCLVLHADGYGSKRRGSTKACAYHAGQHSTVKYDIPVRDRDAETPLEESLKQRQETAGQAGDGAGKSGGSAGKSGRVTQTAGQAGDGAGKSGRIPRKEISA